MQMKKHIHLSILAVIIINLVLLTGCQSLWTSGPRYPTVKDSLIPEPGKGLVIIYAKPGFWGGGPNKWKIYANGQVLTKKFKLGTFYSYQADPGELRLTTKKNNSMSPIASHISISQPTLQIKTNLTYYVEAGFYGGVQVDFLQFEQVLKEKGEKGTTDCKWINHP